MFATYGIHEDFSAMYRRIAMLLEDGDTKRAEEYCEQILQVDPENAAAYKYKLFAEFGASSFEQLIRNTAHSEETGQRVLTSANWKRAVQFADARDKAAFAECAVALDAPKTDRLRQETATLVDQAEEHNRKIRRKHKADFDYAYEGRYRSCSARCVELKDEIAQRKRELAALHGIRRWLFQRRYEQELRTVKYEYKEALADYSAAMLKKEQKPAYVPPKYLPGMQYIFGTYPNRLWNSHGVGSEIFYRKHPILWTVLESDDSCITLLSEILFDHESHKLTDGNIWGESTLRERLNGYFLTEAFSPSEQSRLIPTTIKAEGVGKDTCDKVWLLSYSEAAKYAEAGLIEEPHSESSYNAYGPDDYWTNVFLLRNGGDENRRLDDGKWHRTNHVRVVIRIRV